MMVDKRFFLYADEEQFPRENAQAIEQAMLGFVKSDVNLAVEISFVSDKEIRALNAQTRGIDKVTDVLSYPALDNIRGKALKKKEHLYDIDEEGNLLLGCIVICLEKAKAQAEEYGHSYNRELHYLMIHGIMHCLGYDHITDEDRAQMREREEYILQKLGITRAD